MESTIRNYIFSNSFQLKTCTLKTGVLYDAIHNYIIQHGRAKEKKNSSSSSLLPPDFKNGNVVSRRR